MDILKVLRAVEEVEGKLGSLYASYCEWFQSDPEAAALFNRLSREESAHRNAVRFQITMAGQNRGDFKDLEVDLEAIRGLATLIDQARNAKVPPTLEEAVKLALQFENEEAAKHYRSTLIKASNPNLTSLMKSFKSLGSADGFHLRSLEEFAKRRGFLAAATEVSRPTLAPSP